VGHLETDDKGIAVRGLLVRHLVLPGCAADSLRCLDFLAGLSPDTFISIMSQYSPQYKARAYPEIARPLAETEYAQVTDHALELGLENIFIQELASQEQYLPDFEQQSPFNSSASVPGRIPPAT
jgi:putative pyruvate formate lyase activating enzyme